MFLTCTTNFEIIIQKLIITHPLETSIKLTTKSALKSDLSLTLASLDKYDLKLFTNIHKLNAFNLAILMKMETIRSFIKKQNVLTVQDPLTWICNTILRTTTLNFKIPLHFPRYIYIYFYYYYFFIFFF